MYGGLSALYRFNMYPMMITSSLGVDEPSTIIEGVILLWDLGSYLWLVGYFCG